MARPRPEHERERDLIEAGLNEPLQRPEPGAEIQGQWSSRIASLERVHNLGVMARMLLNGESRFLSVCDVNGLDVAKRSPATTSTLEA